MITNVTCDGMFSKLYGLSTDTKPTDVPNASRYYEMDTATLYIYDAENQHWYPVA